MGEEHPDPSPYVILDNIGRFAQQPQAGTHPFLNDRVVVTLINIEEDRVLHNSYASQSAAGTASQPRQKLSLYCLFSMPFEPYSRSLQFLSLVMDFFYHQPRIALAPYLGSADVSGQIPENVEIELISLTLEQQYQLWSLLGCKQLPSALYKIRI